MQNIVRQAAAALRPSERGTTFACFFRYAVVSAASTLTGLAMLAVLVGVLHWSAGLANLVVAGVTLGPLYAISRRWVWRFNGPSSLAASVVPFWICGILSVAASTGAAGATGAWARRLRLPYSTETALVVGAVLMSYAVFWLLRFVVIDRFIFRR